MRQEREVSQLTLHCQTNYHLGYLEFNPRKSLRVNVKLASALSYPKHAEAGVFTRQFLQSWVENCSRVLASSLAISVYHMGKKSILQGENSQTQE